MKLLQFKEFYKHFLLNEGGFVDIRTQSTIITPLIIKKVFEKFNTDVIPKFNLFLSNSELPPIVEIRPAGSARKWREDLKNDPNRVYGDLDLEFVIPYIKDLPVEDGKDIERQMESLYLNMFTNFVDNTNVKGLEHANAQFFIFEYEKNQFIQVDFISILEKYAKWTNVRFKPVKGFKGTIVNTIYVILGEIINFSLNEHGVKVKRREGKIVSARARKDVEKIDVTENPFTFLTDILSFICKQYNEKMEISNQLKKMPGRFDYEKSESLEDLFISINGFFDSMELSNLLQYYEFGDVQSIKNLYLQMFEDNLRRKQNAAKFDKAETEVIKANVQKFKQMIDDAVEISKKYIK